MDKQQISCNKMAPSTSKSSGRLSSKSTYSKLHKCVKFENKVEIFRVTDAWKIQIQKCNLKSEEEQVNDNNNKLLKVNTIYFFFYIF